METKYILKDQEIPSIIIGKLMNIGGILEREGNRLLHPYQMNHQQFSVLFEIAKAKEVQQKNMVNRLLLEKAHVSKVVKKLQAMGLIELSPMPDDKRSAVIAITEKGQDVVNECRAMFQDWNMLWSKEFESEELRNILENVSRIQQVFKIKFSK